MSTESRPTLTCGLNQGQIGRRKPQVEGRTPAVHPQIQTWQRQTLIRAALAVVCAAAGCSTEMDTDAPGQTVMVDQETGEAMVRPQPDSYPAVHPATGRRTLMPALYCPDCRKWYPTPPPEVINRQPRAGLCPKTKRPLTTQGPWPEQTTTAQEEKP